MKKTIFMISKEIEYTDELLDDIHIIDDFLPPPEQLLFKEENVKGESGRHHTQDQKMIRKLLDVYAEQHR